MLNARKYIYKLVGLLFIIALTYSCDSICSKKIKKTVFIVLDGIPADMIERLELPAIKDIASYGSYSRAYCGGHTGKYDQTPTISAVGYACILTSTWAQKHNVWDNSPKVNYNYPSIFLQAKQQEKPIKTAIYSSWTDNRTVLLGHNLPQTQSLQIDYIYDGLDIDQNLYPQEKDDLHIFKIDEAVSIAAAKSIKEDAPDLSWVYLWYTDDASHIYGNGDYFDEYTIKADKQVARIWESVKYRQEHFNEEWMIVVTTDHGRGDNGYGHGGQSERERTCWIATNQKTNNHFNEPYLAITDINPTICRFMEFNTPTNISYEKDGVPFIGRVDIRELKAEKQDGKIRIMWKNLNPDTNIEIYSSYTNNFNSGGTDQWTKIGETESSKGEFYITPDNNFKGFAKFAVSTAAGYSTCWYVE